MMDADTVVVKPMATQGNNPSTNMIPTSSQDK